MYSTERIVSRHSTDYHGPPIPVPVRDPFRLPQLQHRIAPHSALFSLLCELRPSRRHRVRRHNCEIA